MRIGASLFLIAVGAILKFAVSTGVNGVNLGTVGIILMVIGVVGLLITLVLMSTRRRTDVVHSAPAYVADGRPVVADPVVPAERRTTYVEPRDPRI